MRPPQAPPGGGDVPGGIHEGEHQIFSAITFPRCPHLSVSACLKISSHKPHLPCGCSIHRNHLHCSGHGGVMLANPMWGELDFCWCTTPFAGVFFARICKKARDADGIIAKIHNFFARVRCFSLHIRSITHKVLRFAIRKRVHQQDFSGGSVEGVPKERRFCNALFQKEVRCLSRL